ncbi:MAG: nitroreductase family protein [Bacillota bacterium]
MSLYDAIKSRVSIRKYEDKLLDQETIKWFEQRLKSCLTLYGNINTRLELITDSKTVEELRIGFLFGYAKINAPHCIVAITEDAPGCMENIGFIQEQVVLEAAERGIGTCWLGTYNSDKARQFLNLKENEFVVNMIALGYPQVNNSFLNNGFRKLAGASKRKKVKEIAFYNGWDRDITECIQQYPCIGRILEMSILAPSANNAQPVRAVVTDNSVAFFTKNKASSNKYKDVSMLDAGIFISHFYLSCQSEGLAPEFYQEPDSASKYNVPSDFTYVISQKVKLHK